MLDIEGTTTPVSFVFEVLFPFAREAVAGFLAAQGQEPEVQADLALLRQEYDGDGPSGPVSDHRTFAPASLPGWEGDAPTAAVPYIHYLIKCDRKSTGLKSLQGKLWDQGYGEGRLQSQVFPDVKPAFQRWTAAGKRLYIFSSGSIQAQKLLFAHTPEGDLTVYLSGYFDTTSGPKREAASYRTITRAIAQPPSEILFISDVVAELEAAQAAGLQTAFSYRPGNASADSQGFRLIHSFDDLP